MATQKNLINLIATHAKKGWNEIEQSERAKGSGQSLIALALIECIDVPNYKDKIIDPIMSGNKEETTRGIDVLICDVYGWAFFDSNHVPVPAQWNNCKGNETAQKKLKDQLRKDRNKLASVINAVRPLIWRATEGTKADRSRCKLNTRSILQVPGSLFYSKKELAETPERKGNIISLSGGNETIKAAVDNAREFLPEHLKTSRGTKSPGSTVTDLAGAISMVRQAVTSWDDLDKANKEMIADLQEIMIALVRLDVAAVDGKKKRGKHKGKIAILADALDTFGDDNETIATIMEHGSIKPEADAA